MGNSLSSTIPQLNRRPKRASSSRAPEQSAKKVDKAGSTSSVSGESTPGETFPGPSQALEAKTENLRVEERWHQDHWDHINFENVWSPQKHKDPWDQFNFYTDWAPYDRSDGYMPNDNLYNDQVARNLCRNLAGFRRRDVLALDDWRGPDCNDIMIPLFKGSDGDEYQLHFSLGTSLPQLKCPERSYFSKGMYYVVSRTYPTENPMPRSRMFIQLGRLEVRTQRREDEPGDDSSEWPTEMTDFEVMMEADSDEMPVWIFAGQLQLRERTYGTETTDPDEPCLPLFDGLMIDNERLYDAACILPSIYRLGASANDANAVTYQEACELVRKTRTVMDPILVRPPESEVEEYAKSRPNDVEPETTK